MSWAQKIRYMQLTNYAVSLFAIIFLFSTGQWNWLWITLASYILLGTISYGLTLHRFLAHRSFVLHRWLEILLSYISIFSTVGPTIAWVAMHRHHHKHSDTQADPHSPHNSSLLKIYAGYIEENSKNVSPPKDLLKDPLHKNILKNYFKILFFGLAILIVIDPLLFVFAYSLPTSLALHGATAVNSVCHSTALWSYRSYETRDKSTNNFLINFITLGEGWHNNHHNNPAKWNTAERWFEVDPIAWVISLIRKR